MIFKKRKNRKCLNSYRNYSASQIVRIAVLDIHVVVHVAITTIEMHMENGYSLRENGYSVVRALEHTDPVIGAY